MRELALLRSEKLIGSIIAQISPQAATIPCEFFESYSDLRGEAEIFVFGLPQLLPVFGLDATEVALTHAMLPKRSEEPLNYVEIQTRFPQIEFMQFEWYFNESKPESVTSELSIQAGIRPHNNENQPFVGILLLKSAPARKDLTTRKKLFEDIFLALELNDHVDVFMNKEGRLSIEWDDTCDLSLTIAEPGGFNPIAIQIFGFRHLAEAVRSASKIAGKLAQVLHDVLFNCHLPYQDYQTNLGVLNALSGWKLEITGEWTAEGRQCFNNGPSFDSVTAPLFRWHGPNHAMVFGAAADNRLVLAASKMTREELRAWAKPLGLELTDC
ncbi:MAG: hypothetical protein P8N76_17640 [Pirellulaceae bacterium]|nr:hypothetical protein [Pirellulaceae bacterium]